MPILGSHLFRLRMAMELPLIQMRRAARTWSVETTRKVTVYPWVTMCLPLFLFFSGALAVHTHKYIHIHIHVDVDVNIDICRYTMMHTCLESQSCWCSPQFHWHDLGQGFGTSNLSRARRAWTQMLWCRRRLGHHAQVGGWESREINWWEHLGPRI